MEGAVMELGQQFYFEAAHTLEREIAAAGSRQVHGHTYQAEVSVVGKPDERGMIVDLGHLRQAIDAVRDRLDHRLLDDLPDLGPATLENLASYVARSIQPSFPNLASVKVWRKASGDSCTLRLVASA